MRLRRPDFIFSSVATNPEGLMMAFLVMSMAAYAGIVTDGFTFRSGLWLTLTAVGSVSCKEQSAPAYFAMYGWLLFSGIRQGRQFWMGLARAIAIGIGVYLVLNVIYAPAMWWEHIRYWVGGPGEDPAVWARADYSRAAYLRDAFTYFFYNLGPGASAILILAAISTIFVKSGRILGAWIPLLGYSALFFARTGYLARHYLLPVTVLAALPIAMQIAAMEKKAAGRIWQVARSAIAIALVLNLWAANMAWAQVKELTAWLIEDYAAKNVGKQETVNLGNPWKVRPGITRLAYLGYKVDDRPLAELMKGPPDLPDVVVLSRDWDDWMRNFSTMPARSKFYEWTGYSYANFHGMESLGYHLADTVHPQIVSWLQPPLLPWPPYRTSSRQDLVVYRRSH